MDSFLFSLLIVFALALGGRDQWLIARWADALGQSAALLAVGLVSAALTAALMACAGAGFAAQLPPRAGQLGGRVKRRTTLGTGRIIPWLSTMFLDWGLLHSNASDAQ